MFFFKEMSIPECSFFRKREFPNVLFKGKEYFSMTPFICFHEKKMSNCYFFVFRDKEYVEIFSAFGFHYKRCCRSHLDCKHFGRAPGLSSA